MMTLQFLDWSGSLFLFSPWLASFLGLALAWYSYRSITRKEKQNENIICTSTGKNWRSITGNNYSGNSSADIYNFDMVII